MKNKKALISAAAGAALLLTSGATFALWQDSAALEGNSVLTGSLSVEVNDIEWEDVSTYVVYPRGTGVLVANSSVTSPITWTAEDDLLSPGDTITGTISVEAFLDGTNLVGILTVNGTDELVLPDDVTVTVGTAQAGESEITITIAFAQSATASQNETVSLDDASVVLTQVRAAD